MLRTFGRALALVFLLLPALSAGASAQTPDEDPAVVSNTHSPIVAGVVEWILPTAGYAYAGDWTRGFLSNAVRVGGVVGLLATYDESTETCGDACTAWGLAALAGSVWAIVGAVSTARDHNARLRAATSRFEVSPGPAESVSVGIRLRH